MRDHARSTENGTGHILPYAIYGKKEIKYVMFHLSNRNMYDLQLHIIVTYRVMNLSAVTAGNSISFSFLLKCLVRKRALTKGPFIYYVIYEWYLNDRLPQPPLTQQELSSSPGRQCCE